MTSPPGCSTVETGASAMSDALCIKYIRLLRVFMSLCASWPYEVFTDRMRPLLWAHRICAVCLSHFTVVGQICFLVHNVNILSFFDIGQIYMTTFFAILCSIRTLLPLFKAYGHIIKEFLLSFHLVHFQHKGGFYQQIHEKVGCLSNRVVTTTLSLGLISIFLFNAIPVVNNIKSGAYHDQNVTVELAVYISYPNFDAQEHVNLITAWNIFLVLECVVIITSIDCTMLIIIFQIIGHIEVLRHNLTQIPKPESHRIKTIKDNKEIFVAVAMLDDQQNLTFAEKIKQCVQHHLFIIRFTDKVSQFFGPVLAVYYVFYLVNGCLMLLEMSSGDAASLVRYGSGTVVMFGQLIILSTVFEVVKTRSESLVDTLYSQEWESASVGNQRAVCMLLRELQSPILVKALGVTPVNLQTMVAILKTSFSYFAFLKTLDD